MNILVWLGNEQIHPAIYPNMKSIADAFAELGHRVITCNTAVTDEVMAAISLLRVEKIIDLSIGPNGMGMDIKVMEGGKIHTYEDIDTIHISILLDEPFNPYCNGYDSSAKRHIVTYLDRSDWEYFSRLRIAEDKYKLFMPLGGTSYDDADIETMLARKKHNYDVVVSAGRFVKFSTDLPDWSGGGATPGMISILNDILELMRSAPLSVVKATDQVLKTRGLEDPRYFESIAVFFPLLLCHIKPWRRWKMIQSLLDMGIVVDIFGSDWEMSDFENNVQVRLHGEVAYQKMLQVIAEASIVVNDEACFNDGAHDRVFTAALNGTVVVSEYSAYLAEEFTEKKDIFFFDWNHRKEQLQIIPELLQNDAYREQVARNAYARVAGRHTWSQRAERMLEAAELMEFQRKLHG